MEKNSKITVLGGVLAVSLLSRAEAGAVNGGVCSAGVGQSIVGSPTSFIRENILPRCSSGVTASYNQDAVAVSVRAASLKGMHTFGGWSGAGIAQCESSSVADPAATAAIAPSSPTGGCS